MMNCKEDKYRALCYSILEWIDGSTDWFDDLCDCDILTNPESNGCHSEECRTMLFRKDADNFNKRLLEIQKTNAHKRGLDDEL